MPEPKRPAGRIGIDDMNINSTAPLNVGILIFDGVKVLDFVGSFKVFSRTRLIPGMDSQ